MRENDGLVRLANQMFLWCIVFEVIGIMTILFLGTLGAQMAIYGMTFIFAFVLYRKHKDEISIKINGMHPRMILHLVGISLCGVPLAMLLNAFASVLQKTGTDGAGDVNVYPFWLSLIAYAIVPAVVEEFVFRGLILGMLSKREIKAGILISSLFFALLHFSLGSVMYGFLFGVIFGWVYVMTGNLLCTIIMHLTFNSLNVMLSYLNVESAPIWLALVVVILGAVGFIFLFWRFIRENIQDKEKRTFKGKISALKMITREGYVSVSVCIAIMGMLVMMNK